MDERMLERHVVRAFEHFTFDLPLQAIVAPASRPSRSALRVVTALTVPLVVVFAIGVLLGRQVATPPSVFGSWQSVPSIADPKLAAAARGVCLHEGELDSTLLIQDQRGLAAAMLFQNGSDMVMCVAFFDASGGIQAATSSATHLSTETTTFGLDSVGRAPSSATNAGLTWLFGHQPTDARDVILVLKDGTEVTASVSRGWFLAWWPSEQTVTSMSAIDGQGSPLSVVMPESSPSALVPTEIASSAGLPNPGGTCAASDFVLGTPTYSKANGFPTLGSTVVFATVPVRNTGASCVLALPRVLGVAGQTGPFRAAPVSMAGPVTSWASGAGESLPLVISATWSLAVRDSNGNAAGPGGWCEDPLVDVTRLQFPFASGSAVIDLPTTWLEVCLSSPSLAVTFETK
jgi:hypothetical protein